VIATVCLQSDSSDVDEHDSASPEFNWKVTGALLLGSTTGSARLDVVMPELWQTNGK